MSMPSKPGGRSRKAPKKATRATRAAAPARKRAPAARAGAPSRSRAARRTPRSAVRLADRTPVVSQTTRSLNKRDLDEFRRLLEAERDRLTEQLEAIEEHLPEVENVAVDASGGYDEDLADVASETFEREKGIAIENSEQDLLQQVEEALARIEDGTYGVCEVCGQLIHPDRLRALPWARLCINCKAREEQAIPR
jgi:RNA polymerase-binding protein DksA